MAKFDVYLIGVGGQGIGLLSEVLARAVDYSGQVVIGADTHGLAQRGGTVASHLRIGPHAHSVLIGKHNAEMVLALERHEALRGMVDYLKDGGTLVYYDVVWQPLDVRLRRTGEVTTEDIEKEAARKSARVIRLFKDDLADSRMQNVVILGELAGEGLLPNVNREHYINALEDLLGGETLKMNLEVFESVADRKSRETD